MKTDAAPYPVPASRDVKGQRPGPAGSPASGPTRLSAADLFRLRRAHLEAQDAQLRADLARQRLLAVTLALERRYGLLGRPAAIDVHTGAIVWPEATPREGQKGDNALGHPDPITPRPAR